MVTIVHLYFYRQVVKYWNLPVIFCMREHEDMHCLTTLYEGHSSELFSVTESHTKLPEVSQCITGLHHSITTLTGH